MTARTTTAVYIAVALVVWLSAALVAPHLAVVVAIAASLVGFLLIRVGLYDPEEKAASFFLYDRRMPSGGFVPTFVTSNIGLFSSIAFSTILAHYYGPAGMFWTVVAWFAGMYWFSRYIPRLLPFFRQGSTIHEYIAEYYGTSPHEKKLLRAFTSLSTMLLYWASLGIEIKFGADVLAPTVGATTSVVVAVGIAGTGFLYTYLAGFKGVVKTDVAQFAIMLVGAGAVLIHLMTLLPNVPVSPPDWDYSAAGLLLGPDPLGLLSVCLLLVFYQFCVMDMWQRCIAVAQGLEGADDAATSDALRKLTFRKAIAPFLFFFVVWFAIGTFMSAARLGTSVDTILPDYLAIFDGLGMLGVTLQSLIVLAFVSAIVSTVDTFLAAVVQTFMYDVVGTLLVPGLTTEIEQGHSKHESSFVNMSRVLVILFGASGTVFAFLQFGLMNFWVSMYSIMLAFFPSIYLSLRQWRVPYKAALRSILAGSASALALGTLGTFVVDSAGVTSAAPFAAVAVAFMVLLLARPRKEAIV